MTFLLLYSIPSCYQIFPSLIPFFQSLFISSLLGTASRTTVCPVYLYIPFFPYCQAHIMVILPGWGPVSWSTFTWLEVNIGELEEMILPSRTEHAASTGFLDCYQPRAQETGLDLLLEWTAARPLLSGSVFPTPQERELPSLMQHWTSAPE